ncbi:MAG: biotin--[acetyl-CoA-carboxylase] ligase [Bacteroidia bacterium]|nr:biotin--[acetyl-CoA-carboxylase] ligase [Bacteroidia bacterium]MDW8088893.1 biotin--[acetyl-CoA-carboxylase] ligase [Bacteroidia bacterium]
MVKCFQRHFFSELDSTQSLLRQWASQATLPEGTLIWTRHQRAGYGRQGRSWWSSPGESLTFSFLLYPSPTSAAYLSAYIGVALHRTLQPYTAHPLYLKWPNDLWCIPQSTLPAGKLAGILIEVLWPQPSRPIALVGIGVNVYQRRFPPGLWACSLAQIGTPPRRLEALLDAFEAEFTHTYTLSESHLRTSFLAALWRKVWVEAGGQKQLAEISAWEGDKLRLKALSGEVWEIPAAQAAFEIALPCSL